MYLDTKFFKNVIHMLETDHNLVRPMDEVTEAWKFHVDQTIRQCKEIMASAAFQEEREIVFSQFDEVVTKLETLGWYPVLKTDSYTNTPKLTFEFEDEEQDG